MRPEVQDILEELTTVDPAFGSAEFARVVETMHRIRPRVRLRKDFQSELRKEIVRHAEMASKAANKKEKTFAWFSWQKLSIFSTGLAFAAFAIFTFRQLDFFPASKDATPAPALMQAPALGGAVNRAMPTEMAPQSDDMAAVRNISPKLSENAAIPESSGIDHAETPQKSVKSAQPATRDVTDTQTPSVKSALPPQESTRSQPEAKSLSPVAPESLSDVAPVSDSLADMPTEGMLYGAPLGDASSSAPSAMMAKIAGNSVRFSFSGSLPDLSHVDTISRTEPGVTTIMPLTLKSSERIHDEMASWGYYREGFTFDGTVRELGAPVLSTLTLERDGARFSVPTLVWSVRDPAATWPKEVTVVIAEGF